MEPQPNGLLGPMDLQPVSRDVRVLAESDDLQLANLPLRLHVRRQPAALSASATAVSIATAAGSTTATLVSKPHAACTTTDTGATTAAVAISATKSAPAAVSSPVATAALAFAAPSVTAALAPAAQPHRPTAAIASAVPSACTADALHRLPHRTLLPRGHRHPAPVRRRLLLERHQRHGRSQLRHVPSWRLLRRRIGRAHQLLCRQLCERDGQCPLHPLR